MGVGRPSNEEGARQLAPLAPTGPRAHIGGHGVPMLDPRTERADHEDIDDVMLATTLVPEGVLVLPTVR